ncbi:hypothetical protein ABFS82_01G081400 [Erythranthe guttata]|uniref:protein FAM63A-like n=1 Tax=Erythranthe guttata TaxID=4155 RepID=UPI00064DD865|nr:PREDICTED: protein FAM63A-like [Erythranthe guttata]|eukprot:XP_012835491.1 PREDICTED: protein FAM63A-like [Erythranthe guttata]
MDSSSESTSTATVPPSPARLEAERDKRVKGVKHSIKFVQYFGRTTPIVLQNDNGPCPLIAICNALSLKNSLGSGLNNPEVSQEQLLSLVYDRMMHSKPGTYKDIEEMFDLLRRLTTGINVNIKFRRIDDFELTPECAIFGLLDIPLYHGWIVDPQDKETYAAIGSESYDILAPESLETKSEQKKKLEDDNVDFAAATITSAPVLASPSPSRDHSFDDSRHRDRKGDIEEEAEVSKTLELSEVDRFTSVVSSGTHLGTSEEDFIEESEETGSPISSDRDDIYEDEEESIVDSITVVSENREPVNEGESVISLQTKSEQKKKLEDDNVDFAAATITSALGLPSPSPSIGHSFEEEAEHLKTLKLSEADERANVTNSEKGFTKESEETGTSSYENQEPVYEGDRRELIKNFINGSQLTVYGLSCLQDEVTEREICVFFRNNHFNTMFKYEGELYILATDQGFIDLPDLVWEKLNEVNGDTVYMTCDFKVFKMDDFIDSSWDKENAMEFPSTIGSSEESSSFDSDSQLAIALQQKEYEECNLQPPTVTGGSSSLVTDPPVSGTSSEECTNSSKPKEKRSML